MAQVGSRRVQSIFRSTDEWTCAACVSISGSEVLASYASAKKSEDSNHLGSNVSADRSMAAISWNSSSLSFAPYGRYYLRQEPDALVALVRIRGGGSEQSLVPTPTLFCVFGALPSEIPFIQCWREWGKGRERGKLASPPELKDKRECQNFNFGMSLCAKVDKDGNKQAYQKNK